MRIDKESESNEFKIFTITPPGEQMHSHFLAELVLTKILSKIYLHTKPD
jgi:hypothetical protein